MAKASIELKIDTTEATKKLERLKSIIDDFNKSLAEMKSHAEKSAEAMQEFSTTCENIKISADTIEDN